MIRDFRMYFRVICGLQANYYADCPGIFDLGAIAILEELAGAVAGIETEFSPHETAHKVKVYLFIRIY